MKRNYSLDLLRVFLCISVIALHSLNYFGIENRYVSTIVAVFLMQANGVFYMLSGYFNLEKQFNSSSDIIKFYKNKIIYTLFPFLAFLFVWHIWDYLHINEGFVIGDFFYTFYESVMNSSSDGHLWFMYPLFGLLLSTPFLSKMLHNMNEKELKIMWYVAIGWNVICYFLCYDLGISFRFLGWFLDGWPIYYVGGFYYRHVVSKEKGSKWAIIGILGFVLTNCGVLFAKRFMDATDYQPLFTLFCMGCLMFWDKLFSIKNEKVQKVIGFLSRNTFMIYLFHMRGMEYAIRKLSIVDNNLGNGLLVVLGTFVFSLVASFVANLLMKPVQKLIDRVWKVKEVTE